MSVLAPPRPSELLFRRLRLTVGPLAATEARSEVRTAIRSWEIPVDEDAAVLLTSELVTNAIRNDAGRPVMLVITCSGKTLRVDVHDTSRCMPVVVVDASADAETGRGLMLVASLSADWGFYRTPAGKAVFFTLALQPDLSPAGWRAS